MCYFFKKIKNLLQFAFEKINCCAKRERKKLVAMKNHSPPHPLPPPRDIKWSVP